LLRAEIESAEEGYQAEELRSFEAMRVLGSDTAGPVHRIII
jgi:hypothetical protein